jgi:hypothetical protein
MMERQRRKSAAAEETALDPKGDASNREAQAECSQDDEDHCCCFVNEELHCRIHPESAQQS